MFFHSLTVSCSLRQISWFLRRFIFFVFFFCVLIISFVSPSFPMHQPPEAASICSPSLDHVLRNQKREGHARSEETKYFCVRLHKTTLAHHLLCQSQTQTRFPVWLPVSQWTTYMGSTYHKSVRYCDLDCILTINPVAHVHKGFFYFFCHELTQIFYYNQGLIYKHATNNKKQRKMFLLIMAILTVIVFLFVFPPSTECFYWILLVGVTVWSL